MKKQFLSIVLLTALLAGCKKYDTHNDPVTYGASFVLTIHTDKAVYKPGETVQFSLNKPLAGDIKIRYRRLSETISESPLTGNSWTWTAPATDYTGYLVDLYAVKEGQDTVYASIGVDVSSDWARFPRYGFLTDYSNLAESDINSVLNKLTRHHINGIQYYDWQYKHHWPLGGTAAAPFNVWKELANKDVYQSTLKAYIDGGHQRNMKAMFYNLAFGALSDAAADGVAEEWYAFKDASHTLKDKHALPQPFFKSDIYVTDAGNTAWQQYLANRNNDVYAVLGFDGFHVDALGDRGSLYTYGGQPIDQAATFHPFLQAMKTAAPGKRLLMNAVNQYGQQGSIANAPVDFLYTEVWGPNDGFSDLASIIKDNNSYSGNTKNTVLAAYLNYDHAENAGFFNTPAVLLADAVIFAFGGAHLELGEHMLAKEYFPNNNLQMNDELRVGIMRYYDFLVAYENLLRDGGQFNTPVISCTNNKMTLNGWPAEIGKVAVIGKEMTSRQVLHLVNFNNANSLLWRDTKATQAKPNKVENAVLQFSTGKTVKKVWVASPDQQQGVAMNLPFTQAGNLVSFTLPALLYWDMVVVEY
ncbi:MAG: glycoside hydrolase family 66 protein [Candidatus Pseudobacter hemicellulosilyticus]|uniref:Glycoside hydrolase family 66 protein n=1 Tax=Candidatus Pseudobacter hemicellulosilyticus TaxID=3121375 RepID=A0AAJ6BJ28_9BACT|nr:MAG: glycoside hydrolase family 66 protein [Pseudobacter sp.]